MLTGRLLIPQPILDTAPTNMANPDPTLTPDSSPRGVMPVRVIGIFALVGSLLVISLSVVGRHLNIPLPGSLEIVELLFVLVAACAMFYATVERAHAAARLFLDRLPSRQRHLVERSGLLFGALMWLSITIGNLWLLAGVWSLHEETPLLGIPVVPFRIALTTSTAAITLVLIWQFFHFKDGRHDEP